MLHTHNPHAFANATANIHKTPQQLASDPRQSQLMEGILIFGHLFSPPPSDPAAFVFLKLPRREDSSQTARRVRNRFQSQIRQHKNHIYIIVIVKGVVFLSISAGEAPPPPKSANYLLLCSLLFLCKRLALLIE